MLELPSTDAELLNLSLELSLEFGASWLKPIQSRLRDRHPQLTAEQADAFDVFARGTRDWAHQIIGRSVGGALTEQAARKTILETLPWLDATTFAHLWSQGIYYASK